MSTHDAHNKRVIADRDLGEPNDDDNGSPQIDFQTADPDYLMAAMQEVTENFPQIDPVLALRTARAIRAFDTLNAHMWAREECIKALLNLPDRTLEAIENFALYIDNKKGDHQFINALINAAKPPRKY